MIRRITLAIVAAISLAAAGSLCGEGLPERMSGAVQATPDAKAAGASITATLSAEIVEALGKLPAYQTITGLYDRNKGDPAWLKSEQGLTVARLLGQIRSDAAAITLDGPKDEATVDYTVDGARVSDANIRADDLEADPSYRAAIADLIARIITQTPQVTKFLDSLGAAASSPVAAPPAAPAPAAQPDPAAQAAARLQQTCDAGSPLDCIQLAQDYTAGTGVTKNDDKATALLMQATGIYQKACDGGQATGCLFAGNMWMKYANNSDSANPLYRKACDGGNATACLDLGEAYQFGYSVPTDNAQAVSFFEKACDGGHPSGCLSAGNMYELGAESPVPQDYARANVLYTKACDGQKIGTDGQFYANPDFDIAQGCEMLGIVYQYGHGVPVDMTQAAALYRKACNLGDTSACDNLKKLGQQ